MNQTNELFNILKGILDLPKNCVDLKIHMNAKTGTIITCEYIPDEINIPIETKTFKLVEEDEVPDMRNHPIYKQIWGIGWYAIYDEEYDGYFLSPIDFYEKHGYCPDGPKFIEMTDEIEDFLNRYCDGDTNCILPPNFESVMESFVVYKGDGDPNKELEEFGFTILEEDNG